MNGGRFYGTDFGKVANYTENVEDKKNLAFYLNSFSHTVLLDDSYCSSNTLTHLCKL